MQIISFTGLDLISFPVFWIQSLDVDVPFLPWCRQTDTVWAPETSCLSVCLSYRCCRPSACRRRVRGDWVLPRRPLAWWAAVQPGIRLAAEHSGKTERWTGEAEHWETGSERGNYCYGGSKNRVWGPSGGQRVFYGVASYMKNSWSSWKFNE